MFNFTRRERLIIIGLSLVFLTGLALNHGHPGTGAATTSTPELRDAKR